MSFRFSFFNFLFIFAWHHQIDFLKRSREKCCYPFHLHLFQLTLVKEELFKPFLNKINNIGKFRKLKNHFDALRMDEQEEEELSIKTMKKSYFSHWIKRTNLWHSKESYLMNNVALTHNLHSEHTKPAYGINHTPLRKNY